LGLDHLRTLLRRHHRIALDTSIFIYQLEANNRYLALTDCIFAWLERAWLEGPDSKALTSTITMTELLVQPYRESDEQRVDEFYGLLSTIPTWTGSHRTLRSPILQRGFALSAACERPMLFKPPRPSTPARAPSSRTIRFSSEWKDSRR
jgi:hypothetical protein